MASLTIPSAEDSQLTVTQAITLAIAILGAVLGIINTWRAIDRDRVRLRVVPQHAIPVGPGMDKRVRMCIEVTNLSTFPLTIAEVGVLFRGTEKRGVVVQPIILDAGQFPRRSEARTAFSAYLSPDAFLSHGAAQIRCAYAKTACGVVAKGDSPALRQMVEEATLG